MILMRRMACNSLKATGQQAPSVELSLGIDDRLNRIAALQGRLNPPCLQQIQQLRGAPGTECSGSYEACSRSTRINGNMASCGCCGPMGLSRESAGPSWQA